MTAIANARKNKMYRKWTIDRLQTLLASTEEGTELEYKRSEKLTKSERNAICKTVSAFANSAGGVLIIGVDANNDGLAKFDGGLDPQEWKAQNGTEPELWLRQVFDASIRRPVPDIDIVSLPHPDNPSRKIYVIDVPQSFYAPHQLVVEKDKFEFHKRTGSKTRQMEEYEIRDVMNRHIAPDLWLTCEPKEPIAGISGEATVFLKLAIKNDAPIPANHFIITFDVDKKIRLTPVRGDLHCGIENGETEFTTGEHRILSTRRVFRYAEGIPIFGSAVFPFLDLSAPHDVWGLGLQEKIDQPLTNLEVFIRWEIEAPTMRKRYGIERIKLGSVISNIPGEGYRIQVEHQTIEKSRSV